MTPTVEELRVRTRETSIAILKEEFAANMDKIHRMMKNRSQYVAEKYRNLQMVRVPLGVNRIYS